MNTTPPRHPALAPTLAAALAALLVAPASLAGQQPDSVSPEPEGAPAADTADADSAKPGPGELAALLPEELPGGFARTEVDSGMRRGEPGAMAAYEGPDGAVELTVGSVPSIQERLVPMLEMRADQQDDVEQATFRDHTAFQGQLQGKRQVLVAVGESLAVSAATSGDVPIATLRAVLEALDWERIEAMAGAGGS